MISDNVKKIMLEMGYGGGFSLEDLIEDTKPCLKTLFLKDDDTFGASGPSFNIGIVDGMNTPEDAIGMLWINVAIAFKGKIKKKKVKERKMKFKGNDWEVPDHKV